MPFTTVTKMDERTFANELEAGFTHLSLTDLLAAREQYQVFLTRHPNVVATAVGRYLIRKPSVWKPGKKGTKPPRTLANSQIDPKTSWPCVLVFVEKWQSEKDLINSASPGAVVPKTLYLPDGRAVPVCIVEAKREIEPTEAPAAKTIRYPGA
jgi:hypothetical protein